jgi:hypothetical protein
MVYSQPMLAVTIIFNEIESLAETRCFGIIIRGFGHTQTHACKDLLRARRCISGGARSGLPEDVDDFSGA